MLETDFQGKFKNWLADNTSVFPADKTLVFEYKTVPGETFNVKGWRTGKSGHELTYLINASNGTGVYHKISDQSSGRKPWDAFFIRNASSYLVVYFTAIKGFCIYDIQTFDLTTINKLKPNENIFRFRSNKKRSNTRNIIKVLQRRINTKD